MKAALALVLALGSLAAEAASAVASGRNWRITIGRMACEAIDSVVVLGARIDYLGPAGLVEAPVSQLVDGAGKVIAPRSLVWKRGIRENVQWLSSGGIGRAQPGSVGEFDLKFDVRGATGELRLEFGDIASFPLTRKGAAADANPCGILLRPDQVQAPRARAAAPGGAKPAAHVYRGAYPCAAAKGALRTIEAKYPPYPPRQLLVFGRGFLPNARQIELPTGPAAAQSYSYSGLDELKPIEDAARRVMAADFPGYRDHKRFFAFNWGSQKARSGNELYAIGVYELRACPG